VLVVLRGTSAPGTTMTSPTRTPNRSDTEETALIRRIVGGQQDLFGDLIAPHLGPVSHIVRAMIGGHPEVDDIVQQTALKALTHLEQFRFEADFSTWLIQIAVNEARQWRRKYASSRSLQFAAPTLPELTIADQRHSPLIEYQKKETSVEVRTALAHLPEKYRIVIFLREVEELSISEVAARLNLTIPAVKTRHRRARQKVAGFLQRSRNFRLRSRAR
jgi:RNA polymerase sigma-70 factor, ECF subfamily